MSRYIVTSAQGQNTDWQVARNVAKVHYESTGRAVQALQLKVKLSLGLTKHYAMKTYREVDV
jgi:hypothetical protein